MHPPVPIADLSLPAAVHVTNVKIAEHREAVANRLVYTKKDKAAG
jgi:hypothetical protein